MQTDFALYLNAAIAQLDDEQQREVIRRCWRRVAPEIIVDDQPEPTRQARINFSTNELWLHPQNIDDSRAAVREVLSHEFTHVFIQGYAPTSNAASKRLYEGLTEHITQLTMAKLNWRPVRAVYVAEVRAIKELWGFNVHPFWRWYLEEWPDDIELCESIQRNLEQHSLTATRATAAAQTLGVFGLAVETPAIQQTIAFQGAFW